jgi:predicted dithiol-disulfide oxidoreductase (DUF899 family)
MKRQVPWVDGDGQDAKDAGEVFRTYSTYGRGVEVMMGTYAMLDLMLKGRNEKEGMDWVRRHDRYE